MKRSFACLALCLPLGLAALLPGCKSESAGSGSAEAPADMPSFTLAWSEYPSWSIFGVADAMDLVNKEKGKLGELEKKHGIDIVLKDTSYDGCLNMFTSGNCDAVCMTNMDALIVSPSRDGVAILPTSTSNGADACVVTGVADAEALKSHKIWGLQDSVSEYCFTRCIEELAKRDGKGFSASDFQFTNQDPGVAAVAMQQNKDTHNAIMVWNPFVLQTLNAREDSKVLFDSSMIPGEIVDMVVVGRDVLEQPGGKKFAALIADTFYTMNVELNKAETGDKVLAELGQKFSKLQLEDMRKVVQQTQFYASATEGAALMGSADFKQTMSTVEKFCVDQGLLKAPSYGFGSDSGKQLLFDPSYIEALK